jgi:omega-amidase
MQDINVALVQADLAWEDKRANLDKFDKLLGTVPSGTDLVVLPEMFNTAFSMEPEKLAEAPDSETTAWLKKKAVEKKVAITGSLIITEDGKYYNRLIWMFPDGTYQYYDKKHLFTLAGEQHHYTAGTEKLVVEFKGWKFCPLICYDLRFPAWIRNTEDYDCLVVVANWPEKRIIHWEHLLYARAIENQCYLVAVNRVGKDGNGLDHNGVSMVINPLGKPLVKATEIETILYVTLNYEAVTKTRKEMPFLNDRDQFELVK